MKKTPLTPHEFRLIKGAIRRVFRQSDLMRQVLNEARVELPPALKKDGTPGARPQVRFKCAVCGGLFPGKWVAVDHKDPVVPVHREELSLSFDEIAYGIWCDKENLQVICSTPMKALPKGTKSCHSLKTDEENFCRGKWKEVLKIYPKYAPTEDEICLRNETYKQQHQLHLEEKRKKEAEKQQKRLEREAKRKAKRGTT